MRLIVLTKCFVLDYVLKILGVGFFEDIGLVHRLGQFVWDIVATDPKTGKVG
jgi:hypothetical protein